MKKNILLSFVVLFVGSATVALAAKPVPAEYAYGGASPAPPATVSPSAGSGATPAASATLASPVGRQQPAQAAAQPAAATAPAVANQPPPKMPTAYEVVRELLGTKKHPSELGKALSDFAARQKEINDLLNALKNREAALSKVANTSSETAGKLAGEIKDIQTQLDALQEAQVRQKDAALRLESVSEKLAKQAETTKSAFSSAVSWSIFSIAMTTIVLVIVVLALLYIIRRAIPTALKDVGNIVSDATNDVVVENAIMHGMSKPLTWDMHVGGVTYKVEYYPETSTTEGGVVYFHSLYLGSHGGELRYSTATQARKSSATILRRYAAEVAAFLRGGASEVEPDSQLKHLIDSINLKNLLIKKIL